MGTSLPQSLNSEDFSKVFRKAITSTDSLITSVNTHPAYWIENLNALYDRFVELENNNSSLRTTIRELEGVDQRFAAAQQAATTNHDLLQQSLGVLALLSDQLQRALSSPSASGMASSSRKLSPKHPHPEIFLGDRDKLEGWIIQVNAKMIRNSDHFVFEGQDTSQNELFYVISRLGGDALGHVQRHVAKDRASVNLEHWTKIIDIMELAYADPDPKGTARRALIALYQNNKKFEVFWPEFHRLSQQAEMSSETTLEYLKDRLSYEIKDRLVNIDYEGMDLAAFVKTVQRI